MRLAYRNALLALGCCGVFATASAQTTEAPGDPRTVKPADGAIIMDPDIGKSTNPRINPDMRRAPAEGILEPNASSGAGTSNAPGTDPQTEHRRGEGDPRDVPNRRDDTGKRDNQER